MSVQKNVLLALGTYDYRTHRGVARYAGQHHWHLNSEMCMWGRLPRGWKGDGILTVLDYQADLVRFIRAATVPVVDLSLNRQDVPLPRVVGDNRLIGQMAAEHFLERGFRHFAWHANHTQPAAEARYAGFAETLEEEVLVCERWIWEPGHRRPGDLWLAKCRWLTQKLQAMPKPGAVFAFRDADAANVLDACRATGLAVPEDVAILGVDNNDLICETQSVPLSSVHHDLERLGYDGAALLDRLMEGAMAPREPILIPPRGIVTRRSSEGLAVRHEPCRRAVKLLQQHFSRNIGVEDAVRASGLSRRGLEKAFRDHVGRSVGEELGRIRLAKVKELLLRTAMPVADIAAATGFHTPQYLNNVFRKATGLTPRKYRMAHRPTQASPLAVGLRQPEPGFRQNVWEI
jgi:LacI family transcriptional regulator